MDSFEPQTAFEGWLVAKIEGLEKSLDEIKREQAELSSRVRRLEIKSGTWGAIAGAITGVLTAFGIGSTRGG